MAAITTNSFVVDIIATVNDKLVTFSHVSDSKADAWGYINAVRNHANSNASVGLCDAVVYDSSQLTGSISRPFKQIYREVLKK